MKNILSLIALLAILAGAACKGNSAKETPAAGAETKEAGTVEASQQLAYICPMRCEGSASNTPGKCPVCGMDLEKNPDHQPAADSTAQPAQ